MESCIFCHNSLPSLGASKSSPRGIRTRVCGVPRTSVFGRNVCFLFFGVEPNPADRRHSRSSLAPPPTRVSLSECVRARVPAANILRLLVWHGAQQNSHRTHDSHLWRGRMGAYECAAHWALLSETSTSRRSLAIARNIALVRKKRWPVTKNERGSNNIFCCLFVCLFMVAKRRTRH